jgi:hypothetical protein
LRCPCIALQRHSTQSTDPNGVAPQVARRTLAQTRQRNRRSQRQTRQGFTMIKIFLFVLGTAMSLWMSYPA